MAGYNLGEARGKIVLETDLKGLKDAQTALSDTKKSAEDSAGAQNKAWKKVGTSATIAGATIAGGFAVAVGAAASFEARLSAIQAVSGATTAEMDLISDAALRIGKDTAFSASEAATAMEELSKAGISTKDILNGAADATVALAAAGGVDLPTAATIAANSMNQFGKSAEDLVAVTDTIAGAANASAIDMGEFAMSMGQVGAVANLAGLSFEDTSLAIAAMGNAGIKGSDAGTSLKSMLMNLQPTTEKASDTMKELGLMTEDGTNLFYDQEGQLKSLNDISALLQGSLAGLSEAQKTAALEAIFGSDAIRAAAIVADTGAEGFTKLSGAINETSAAEVAATRMDNLKGSSEALLGSIETLMIQIGTMLIPRIREMVDGINQAVGWFTSMDETTRKLLVGTTLLAGGLLLALGAFIKIGQMIKATRDAYVALNIAKGIANAKSAVETAQIYALIAAEKIRMGVTKAATAAQWLMNAAMTANPIGLIIAAVVALVAGLIWFFTQTELGQAIWAEFTRFLGEAWTNLQAVAKVVWEGIMAAIDAVVTWFQAYVWPILKFVIDLIIGYFMIYYNIVKFVFEAIFNVINAFVTWFSTNVWPVIEAIVGFLVKLFTFLWLTIEWAWGQIMSFINTVVTAIVSFLTDTWNNFLIGWGIIWDAVSKVVSDIWEGIVAFLKPFVDAIVTWITDLWNRFMLGWNILWTIVRATVERIWNAIKGFLEPIVKGVVDFITNTWSNITSFVETTFNNVKDAILGPLEEALDFIGGIKDTVIGFFKGAGDWLFNAGKDILQGFLDGLNNMLGEIGNFFSDLTNMIPETKGPPKRDKVLLYDNGALIMRSLANGLESEQDRVYKQLAGMTKTIPMTLQTEVNNANRSAWMAGELGAQTAPGDASGRSVVLNFTYNASDNDQLTEQKVINMLGHATELIRKELA